MLTAKKRAVLLSPDDAELRFELAEAFFTLGQLKDAEKQLARALVLSPGHENAQRMMRKVASALGQPPDVSDPASWPEAAHRFAEQGRIDDAILYAEASALRRGADAAAWGQIATWCAKNRLPDRALRAFGRALAISQCQPDILAAKDELLAQLGLDGQLELLSEAPSGALSTAAGALLDGRLSEAKRALSAAAGEDKDSPIFDHLRAEILQREGHLERARAASSKARAKDPRPAAFGTLPARPRTTVGQIGVLGWTPVGGAVSPLEAVAVVGDSKLQFTGNVGETGREAGLVAYSCLKALAAPLKIDGLVASYDLHLHFTDIDFGKEGQSSGLALTLAGLSAFRRRPLRSRLGATGAITLHGEVQRVEGIYEKAVAAKLAGLLRVLYPRGNQQDVRGLPPVVTDEMEWIAVASLDEAIAVAFGE